MTHRFASLSFAVVTLATANAAAYEPYAERIPAVFANSNSDARPCRTCHNRDDGGNGCMQPNSCLNSFGLTFRAGSDGERGTADDFTWGRGLAGLDPDNDGWSSGQELGDPFGTWVFGNPRRTPLSRPGDGSMGNEPDDFDLCDNSAYNDCDSPSDGGTCSSSASNGRGTWSCGCAPGYDGLGHQRTNAGTVPYNIIDFRIGCTDIPECSDPDTCDDFGGRAGCTEMAGSYRCMCRSGFRAPSTGGTCADIRECDDPDTCDDFGGRAGCTELTGTYRCSCRDGFTAPATGGTCTVNNACTAGTATCVAPPVGICTSTGGSGFTCACEAGYNGNGIRTNAGGTGCTDINECTQTAGICGPGDCINRPGTYECDCDTGYEAPATGGTCTDINECMTNPIRCGVGTCMNTPGAFLCECPPGYFFNGATCEDIDECAPLPCGVGTCSETEPPGYICACPQGYLFDDVTCVDIDECLDPLVNLCSIQATCTNTPGSWDCTCNPGWRGDGQNCEDIDECAPGETNECDVNATCRNVDGGHFCTCNEHYEGSGVVCTDINECANGTHGCGLNQVCVNQEGAQNLCECASGYELMGTQCLPVCGNGVVTPGERCDDGNAAADDGCSALCEIEPGWACMEVTGGRSECRETCGDGLIQAPFEECDDGPGNSDTEVDACRTTCRFASCGDGVVDTGEGCDDGDGNSDSAVDACRTTCDRAYCGDGVIDTGEICDQGGGLPTASLSGACTVRCAPDAGIDPNDPPQLTGGACGCRAGTGRSSPALPILVGALFGLTILRRRRR